MFSYGKLNEANEIIEIVHSDTRINDGVHVFLSAEDNFTGESYIGRKWARPSVPWETISPRQARLALLQAGLLSQVDTAINSLESPAKEQAQIEWEYATSIERGSEWINQLGGALGLDDAGIDDLFKTASTL